MRSIYLKISLELAAVGPVYLKTKPYLVGFLRHQRDSSSHRYQHGDDWLAATRGKPDVPGAGVDQLFVLSYRADPGPAPLFARHNHRGPPISARRDLGVLWSLPG